MRYMLIDTSSVVWAGLLSGKDGEHGYKVEANDGREVLVNSAIFGFDKAAHYLKTCLNQFAMAPKNMIFVVEGDKSKLLRTSISDTYKAGRTERRVKEQYEEFNKARDMLVQQFLDLGASSCTQAGVEADDVVMYLSQELPSCVVISTDGDLQQCISEKAHLWYDGKLDNNRYGPFPARYTTLYKATVGDTSDNIKGGHGFGQKAFLDLFCMFGEEGLDMLTEMIQQKRLEDLHENVPELKALQRLIDDRDGVYLSWALASQYPEKINTWRRPLQWSAGMVKPATPDTHPDLEGWTARRKIVHAGNYAASMQFAAEHLPQVEYVALDIETAAPVESDEWLEMKQRAKDKDAEDGDLGVDVLSHELVSQGVTFGDNDQYTFYFTVDHKPADGLENLTSEQVLEFVKLIPQTTPIVVHNGSFELSVLARTWQDLWKDNGWFGFLPNALDTRILAHYVDENRGHGLKALSQDILGYTQTTFQEVTQGRKMNEMTAREAFHYGADDPICTAALFNHFRKICEIEKTFDVFVDVEQCSLYMKAHAFNQGTKISMETMLAQAKDDEKAYEAAWPTVRDYLIAKGWAGTVTPRVEKSEDLTPAFIKEAYGIVVGKKLDTMVRTPSKLVSLCKDQAPDSPFAAALEQAVNECEFSFLNELIEAHFNGEPAFSVDSSPNCCDLLYETMGLKPRIFNKLTDVQRAAGRDKGNPKANDLAVQWALQSDVDPAAPEYSVLKALQVMKIANTRRKLYYSPYRHVQHWKDQLVHSYIRQCGAGTRRDTSADPNLQQLPKHPKATGEAARFRQVYLAHHDDAVVVSLDFSGQELVLITEYSQDENMLACYVGDNKKDMHALTAAGILKKKAMKRRLDELWLMDGNTGAVTEDFKALVDTWKDATYEQFVALVGNGHEKLYKNLRALGKKTNFTTEYGAMAPKLAQTLLIEEDESQEYIDAKLAAFPGVVRWKDSVVSDTHRLGYATTLLGARRHLAGQLKGHRGEVSKAERQAVNFKIQGSAAEQTKLALARMWRAGVCFKYDAKFIGPIHDEVVFSVGRQDLIPFLREVHDLMVAPYATMTVPIVSSISFGLNFGEQHEVGEAVNDAVINDTLVKLFPDKYKEAA